MPVIKWYDKAWDISDTPREARFMSPGPMGVGAHGGGELFVRGSDFSTEFRCDQGESGPCPAAKLEVAWDAWDFTLVLLQDFGHN